MDHPTDSRSNDVAQKQSLHPTDKSRRQGEPCHGGIVQSMGLRQCGIRVLCCRIDVNCQANRVLML